jgi:hypothetical protein
MDDSVRDVNELVSCSDCFAAVKRNDLEKHFEWHQRSVRDAVAASIEVVSEIPEP